jgi:hypothetical protein
MCPVSIIPSAQHTHSFSYLLSTLRNLNNRGNVHILRDFQARSRNQCYRGIAVLHISVCVCVCVCSLRYPACKQHAPCFNVISASLVTLHVSTLPHRDTIVEKKVIAQHKMCTLIFSRTFIFRKKVIEHKMCTLIFSRTFIFRKKVIEHKMCTLIFSRTFIFRKKSY